MFFFFCFFVLFFNLVFFTTRGALTFLLLFFSGVQKMSRDINPSTTNCTRSRILKLFTSFQTNQLAKRGTDIRLASLVYLPCLRQHVLRAYYTFASRQAFSIILFGPRLNNNGIFILASVGLCMLAYCNYYRKNFRIQNMFNLQRKSLKKRHLLRDCQAA